MLPSRCPFWAVLIWRHVRGELVFPPRHQPIIRVTKDSLSGWLRKQPRRVGQWVRANGYKAGTGRHLAVPGEDGKISVVLLGPSKDGMPWDLGG